MTVPDNAYQLAMELQSLTYDMCMLEDTRASVAAVRLGIEGNLRNGVYGGPLVRRMNVTVEALKGLEDRCEKAILTMSEREQEVVWELSGRTSEVPAISECPFCGGRAKLYSMSEASSGIASSKVGCTRCEGVCGPSCGAIENYGTGNPWRNSRLSIHGTVKGAQIEAVGGWNRRVVGGMAVPFEVRSNLDFDEADGTARAKPCPLCGGEPEMAIDDGTYDDVWDVQMVCKGCDMRGPMVHGLDEREDLPTPEDAEVMFPDIEVLESRKAAYLACIEAWDRRVYGREALRWPGSIRTPSSASGADGTTSTSIPTGRRARTSRSTARA